MDLQASVAELVYGEPLRIPGELFISLSLSLSLSFLHRFEREHNTLFSPSVEVT
jgi:hypothetical protein